MQYNMINIGDNPLLIKLLGGWFYGNDYMPRM